MTELFSYVQEFSFCVLIQCCSAPHFSLEPSGGQLVSKDI